MFAGSFEFTIYPFKTLPLKTPLNFRFQLNMEVDHKIVHKRILNVFYYRQLMPDNCR